jgi:hypothetical protein
MGGGGVDAECQIPKVSVRDNVRLTATMSRSLQPLLPETFFSNEKDRERYLSTFSTAEPPDIVPAAFPISTSR